MTREVDVNSGAAPQPGGWAGAEGAARGHALPGWDTEVEQEQELNKAPDVATPKSVQEIVDLSYNPSQGAESEDEDLASSAPEEDDEPKKTAKKAPAKKAAKKS